ncbi:zinc finger protein 800 [Drosophila serrata]|uniref:zinc finger protein 800 n=1 Tax=Drosophila serrata TaxID=7274 RepID=UPI000A1D2E97|nr:zinc finger protein 800 [Drosophila serrata]
MRKRSSTRCNSDNFKEQQMDHNSDDISLLQRPLRTAHTGFEEARRAYEDGTSEVRQLLSLECSLIYECKVCRNMFRSLANFISHKRVFCCVSARSANGNGYTDQNSTMIIQTGSGPSPQDIEHMLRSRSTGCSPVPREARPIRGGGGMRDLSGVIERLRREKAPAQARRSSPTVLQLESVPTSSHAVYQTIKVDQEDSIRTELDEVHRMLNPAETVVGPDGKALTTIKMERQAGSDSGENGDQSISDEAETSIFCEICNLTFQTHKTLELHIQKHHSSSSFVFQCPACSLTFLQAAAVIRHLSKDHKKPTRRIRMMRNTILKRRVQQGDVQNKGPCRELKRLQLSDDVVGYVPEPLNASGEQRKIMSLCIYCEKSFERRAALSTHLLNCRAKQEALAKPAPSVKKLKTKSNDSSLDAADEDPAASMDLPKSKPAEVSTLHDMFAGLPEPNDSFGPGLHTVSLDKLQLANESDSASDEASNSDDEHEQEPDHEPGVAPDSIADAEDAKGKIKKKRNVPVEKQLRCRCKICHKQFNALGNLRRHISMFHYRARRFGCNLCDYRAFRRYDIVNHLGFTHKIEGDRDQLTEQYVSTHECEYSRDDVDGDIILLDKEEEASAVEADQKPPIKTYERRLKRVKAETESTGDVRPISPTAEIKEEPGLEPLEPIPTPAPSKKRRKSRTQISPDSGDQEKRPIRKRVKAVNKDFVYDLVAFKQDASGQQTPAGVPVESMRAKLRRQPTGNSDENKPKQWAAYITEAKKPLILGITRRIMLELVGQGRAVSATLPELPSERPQIRPRLISHTRSDSGQQQQNPNVVETVPTPAPETESFIEKIAKRTAAAGKDNATISNLWNKVNIAIAQQQQQEHEQQLKKEREREQQALEKKPEEEEAPQVDQPKSPLSEPHSPPRICDASALETQECLGGKSGIPGASTMFPALPKPPSVLQAAANGTIQLTLDSLLRAALQN